MSARRRTSRTSRTPRLLPRRKRNRRRVELLGGVAITLFTVVIVGAFFASSFQQFALRSSNVAAVVSAMLVNLANADRTSNDLGTLKTSPLLVAAAQAKANDMATKGYFAHTSPQGIDPWFWFKQVGYKFDYAGENLAVNFSDSNAVNTAWMNSPEHRANLLDPHYTEIGIATAQGMYEGHLATFVVQEFGTPAPSSAPQPPIAAEVVPKQPTTLAKASAKATKVLGTQTSDAAAFAPNTASHPSAAATTAPAVAAALQRTRGSVPLWGYLVSFPRDALRYTYYALALLILAALAFETGLEFHERHVRKAYAAGSLLIAMGVLFFIANAVFFAAPVLASTAAAL